jgi:1,4-alpha-glucan branching enzyme
VQKPPVQLNGHATSDDLLRREQSFLRTQRPPTPLRGGYHIDLLAAGTVTFVIRAPFKPFVSLVGDFNNWNSRANIMTTEGEGIWWTTIAHPGPTRYGFYVAIDDQAHAWVGDPYAYELEWDECGPWAFLPAADVLAERKNFAWGDQEWQTPELRDMVIYEVGIRDFGGEWVANRPRYGTFQDLIDRLDYLADLGINAIELMPIQQFPGESSWGYNPVFYFAPARTYGTPEECMRLVDACHRKGIAVILDVVFNHAWGDHPYYQIYPPMYSPKGEWLPDLNPFFHHTPEAINMWGGVDWDHFVPETTAYFQDVLRHWLQEYHLDGFRFDWVGGVDYDSRNPMRPDFDAYHGIGAICWAARQAKPDVILLGEYWPLYGTHPEKTAAKLIHETEMDAVWNGEFHHTMEDVLVQRWHWEKRDVFRSFGGFREQGFGRADQVINYTASHDEVRPVHEVLFYARQHIQKPDDLSWTEVALRKALLGLITLFAAPGVPMLWMGQEYGEDLPRTIDFLPLKWEKLTKQPFRSHAESVRRLIGARRDHRSLRSDHIEFFADDFPRTHLMRFRRWDQDPDNGALVALNFGDRPHKCSLPFPRDGLWYEVVGGDRHRIKGERRTFTLEPWSGRLYVPVVGE